MALRHPGVPSPEHGGSRLWGMSEGCLHGHMGPCLGNPHTPRMYLNSHTSERSGAILGEHVNLS